MRNFLVGKRGWPALPEPLHEKPKLPGRKSSTGEQEEFDKLAPKNILILWPVNRKVLTPARLGFGRLTVGRHSPLFRSWVGHRVIASKDFSCRGNSGSYSIYKFVNIGSVSVTWDVAANSNDPVMSTRLTGCALGVIIQTLVWIV